MGPELVKLVPLAQNIPLVVTTLSPIYTLPAIPAPPATINAPVVVLVLVLTKSAAPDVLKVIVPESVKIYVRYPPDTVTVAVPVNVAAAYVSGYLIIIIPLPPLPELYTPTSAPEVEPPPPPVPAVPATPFAV